MYLKNILIHIKKEKRLAGKYFVHFGIASENNNLGLYNDECPHPDRNPDGSNLVSQIKLDYRMAAKIMEFRNLTK